MSSRKAPFWDKGQQAIAMDRLRRSCRVWTRLRLQFAHLLTDCAGAEIDMSVLNRKSDDFDTLQVPCSDPGFFGETQRIIATDERRASALRIRIVAHYCHP